MRSVIFLLLLFPFTLLGNDKPFSETLWEASEPIYEEILSHPFVKELASGGLKKEPFEHYMRQDSLYLGEFAKAIAIVAAKFEDNKDRMFLLKEAITSLEAEKELHKKYLVDKGAELSPSSLNYTNHLLVTASQYTKEEGLVALLPCYWIYGEVGKHLKKLSPKGNPYQDWIDMYSTPGYDKLVTRMIALVDRLASNASPETRKNMRRVYLRSARFEWLFWDASYRMEKWKP